MQLEAEPVTPRLLTLGRSFTLLTYLLIGYFIYRTIIYPYYISPLRKIPSPPYLYTQTGSWLKSILLRPIMGHILDIMFDDDVGAAQREWFKKYGGEDSAIRIMGPLGTEIVMFLNPDAHRKILGEECADYPKPAWYRDSVGIAGGYSLLTVEGVEHKKMRRRMRPAFSLPFMVSKIDIYYDVTERLKDLLSQRITSDSDSVHGNNVAVLPMAKWLSRTLLDIILITQNSRFLNPLQNPDQQAVVALEKGLELERCPDIFYGFFALSVPGLASLCRREEVIKWIAGWMGHFGEMGQRVAEALDSSIIGKAQIREHLLMRMKEEQSDSMTGPRDTLDVLLEAREETKGGQAKSGWELDDIVDHIRTLIITGHETSASALTSALYLLAKHQDIQDTLREEVRPILTADSRPSYQTLKDLPWLKGVIMETLRLFPPLPLTYRQANKSDVISGVYVPKGTILCVPIRVINTWAPFWGEDAEQFRPERWMDSSSTGSEAQKSFFKFATFLAGPHECIGKEMGMIQMRVVLASLVANFKFELAYDGQVPQPATGLTMQSKDGMPLRVSRVDQ